MKFTKNQLRQLLKESLLDDLSASIVAKEEFETEYRSLGDTDIHDELSNLMAKLGEDFKNAPNKDRYQETLYDAVDELLQIMSMAFITADHNSIRMKEYINDVVKTQIKIVKRLRRLEGKSAQTKRQINKKFNSIAKNIDDKFKETQAYSDSNKALIKKFGKGGADELPDDLDLLGDDPI